MQKKKFLATLFLYAEEIGDLGASFHSNLMIRFSINTNC
jgi:hypothetical protein